MKKDLSTPPKIDKEALDGDGDDEKFSGSWPPKVEFCHRLNICGHNSIYSCCIHKECTSSLLFQSLNEIMKVDLIKDKTAAEIEQVGNLWL